MSDSDSGKRNGPSFLGMLAIMFIGLKLAGIIDWPWWWVLGPLWIPISVVIFVLLVMTVSLATVEAIRFVMRGRR